MTAALERMQRAFTAVLRTPLDRTSGTLRAAVDDRAAAALGIAGARGVAGLGVYVRQYWFRLFNALQYEFRTVAALAGAWSFNELASQFLLAHPPRGHDLARAADGFADHLAAGLPASGLRRLGDEPAVPRAALLEAAAIDQAFRTVAAAPWPEALQLGAVPPAALATARLRSSPTLVLIEESWALVALRHRLADAAPERRAPLPERHAAGMRTWAISASVAGQSVIPLVPPHAMLVRLLAVTHLADALAQVEAATPVAQRASLAADARRWLADGVERRWWIGVEPT